MWLGVFNCNTCDCDLYFFDLHNDDDDDDVNGIICKVYACITQRVATLTPNMIVYFIFGGRALNAALKNISKYTKYMTAS